jgi:hypothetical protein
MGYGATIDFLPSILMTMESKDCYYSHSLVNCYIKKTFHYEKRVNTPMPLIYWKN